MPIDLKAIIIIVVIAGLVLSVNFTLIGLLRGKKNNQAQASKWGLAIGGARQAQAKQVADSEALHRAVTELQAGPPPTEPPPYD